MLRQGRAAANVAQYVKLLARREVNQRPLTGSDSAICDRTASTNCSASFLLDWAVSAI